MSSLARRDLAPPFLSGLLLVLATAATPVLFSGGPCLLHAQEVESVLQERELEYRSSRSAFEAALQAQAAQERRFYRTLAEIEDARAAGDEDRQAAAFARAQTQALELQVLRRRVDETAARMAEAGRALLTALDDRLEALVDEVEAAPTRAEREDLVAVARNLRARYREVEETLEPDRGTDVILAAVPEIALDPRDGPVELRWKVELLEKRIAEAGARLEELAAQIEELERRRRRNRSLSDLEASIERFDDDRMPVSNPGARRGESGEEAAPLTLEERIERLQVLREEIETRRSRFQDRLGVFRERLEAIGP